MNNVNMAGMNAMGGPVGGANPMMNNGTAPTAGNMRSMTIPSDKSRLNTYIYEYFLTNGMYDCARSILNSGEGISVKDSKDSPKENMDADSKDDLESKKPDDLPLPNIPRECPESCFLYEWWCLFWDMFNAQRPGHGDARAAQYLTHTQALSRMKQEQQQAMLRSMRPDMLPNQYQQMMMRNQQQQNGMNLKQNDIARTAMQNNRNATPQQQMQMLQQQQAAKQQIQRDPSDGNHQRPQSPNSVENAPSPSKRPRLDGTPFNPQPGLMPNGRGNGQGIQPQQFQPFQGQNPAQQKSLAAYQAGLTQHTQGQMPNKAMPNPGGPQNQGSPMMSQGGQDGGAIAGYYNAGEMGAQGMRGAPGGQPNGGGNHALQDYQMQLMLLEQQNKKRLMMARQEQDSMTGPREGMPGVGPGPAGPGVPVPNGQAFQGTSPQGGPRPGASPNPAEAIKRGTPQMNNAGIPSPLPEGQSRGSPSGMNFMPGGQMDPSMNPQFNGMNGLNMMPNGMRPPSSHPAGFNGQMTPQQQQMVMARQAQQQSQAANGWQAGPNGAQMMPQGSQGPPQQMGTPQQRAMPPPSAPTAGAAGAGRTQPSSPQQQGAAPPTPSQSNKANPKAKKDAPKDNKTNKKGGKKGQAPTPAADGASQEPATPTPATPITPVHPKSFNGQNGTVQPMANGQQPAATAAPQQPDPLGGMAFDSNAGLDFQGFEFTNPTAGSMDVLQDFDFDSFLHQDGEGVDNFSFDTSAFLDGGEIGAE